jgi:hypothetical protein
MSPLVLFLNSRIGKDIATWKARFPTRMLTEPALGPISRLNSGMETIRIKGVICKLFLIKTPAQSRTNEKFP